MMNNSKVKYARTYTDPTGMSHFEDVTIELERADFAPPAPPVFLSSYNEAWRYAFCSLPAGWYGDWHPAPQKQLAIILSGQVEVEVSDGEKRSFGPGSIHFMDDTSGKGHITRVVGESDVFTVMIQLP